MSEEKQIRLDHKSYIRVSSDRGCIGCAMLCKPNTACHIINRAGRSQHDWDDCISQKKIYEEVKDAE
jgi:hypothetical protein